MRIFRDSQSTEWTVRITFDAVKRVKGLLGVDLLKLDQGDPPLATRLVMEIELLCDVVYSLVQPEAAGRNIDSQAFGQRLDGASILAAQRALQEELVDFFHQLGRRDVVLMLQKQQKLLELGIAAAEGQIGQVDLDQQVAAVFGEKSTSWPAPSASTPAR